MRRKRILVVDDEPQMCELVKAMLEHDSHIVLTATSASDAMTLLEQAVARLRDEYLRAEKRELYECLKTCLTIESRSVPYAELAAQLKMSEGAIKVAVHRLRGRYRDVLREEIAQTVSSPEEVEEELRHLFAALGN